MKIRAKFRCFSIESFENVEIVKLCAVNILKDDNTDWSRDTPSARLEMTITNPSATAQYKPGKTYPIDITEED